MNLDCPAVGMGRAWGVQAALPTACTCWAACAVYDPWFSKFGWGVELVLLVQLIHIHTLNTYNSIYLIQYTLIHTFMYLFNRRAGHGGWVFGFLLLGIFRSLKETLLQITEGNYTSALSTSLLCLVQTSAFYLLWLRQDQKNQKAKKTKKPISAPRLSGLLSFGYSLVFLVFGFFVFFVFLLSCLTLLSSTCICKRMDMHCQHYVCLTSHAFRGHSSTPTSCS